MAKNKIMVSKSSEDVARALGLSPSLSVEWEVRHSLTKKIVSLVQTQGFTVSEVAKRAGTSRARITEVLKENTEGISVDVLLRIVGALGSSVKLTFKKVA